MIEAVKLCKYFRQPDGSIFRALDDINLRIDDPQCVLIAGPNGSGKSLLMKLIADLETPTKGSVHSSEPVGLVFQDADAQILGDTPLDDVLFGLRGRTKKKDVAREAAMKALCDAGLGDKARSPSHFLSGGEKRRLAIASVIALGRRTLILDEPYSNLDYPGVKSVNSLVEKLRSEGMTIIILSHELEKCMGLADRFIVLEKGKLVFDGDCKTALGTDLESWGIRNPSGNGDPKTLVWR